MMEEQESIMSTRTKINTLINDIQNKLNKRVGYNLNYSNKRDIDLNVFKSFGTGIPVDQNEINSKDFQNMQSQYNVKTKLSSYPKLNNYVNNINENIPINNNSGYPVNEYYLRNLIKEEFSSLILPYQKDVVCNSNLMESKLGEIDKKFQIILNAQNMGNLNDNAKIISAYLCSNLSSDSMNKNIEKLKIEYDTLFDGLQKKIDSLNNQMNMHKTNNDSNISDVYKKMENFEKKLFEIENKDKNKEIKTYVEKNIFDDTVNNLNEKQNRIINDNENKIRNLNDQIDTINKSINQYKLEINKINGLDNNINSLRSEFGKVTEDISKIKYQVTPEVINKINSIDLNSLKQQVSPYEFKSLKDNMNIYETNLNSIKTMAENSDKTIFELKKQITNVEQKQNSTNKNIENIQPLLNENILGKITEINGKIEELSKIKVENENKNNENNDKKENEEKKEEEAELFFGGSRRQQRNNKNTNNNINKSVNNNLDEKSLNLIKQLEKINLDELQKMDFNNILTQINDLSKENKNLSNKIEEQNKTISEINEKIKNLKTNNNNFDPIQGALAFDTKDKDKSPFDFNKPSEINKELNMNKYEINDPYFRGPKNNDIELNNKKKDSININIDDIDVFKSDRSKGKEKEKVITKKDTINNIEEEYDDFDNNFDDNNDFDISKTKDKNKDKDNEKKFDFLNPTSNLEDKNKNKKDDILGDINFNEDIYNNKKNPQKDKPSFDKYSEMNILDQIMGAGSRRNNDINAFDKKVSSGTFITGSIGGIGGSKNNFDINDKPSVFDDEIKNKSKNNSIKDKKDNTIEEKEKEKKNDIDEDFIEDFDDFEDM